MPAPLIGTRTGRSHLGPAVALILLAIVLSGCGASSPGDVADVPARAGWCESLISDASTGSPSPSALDLTLRTCANLDDWLRAVRDHPGLLGGREPLAVLDERCADAESDVASFAVCRSRERALATPPPTLTPRSTRAPRSTPRPRTATRPTERSPSTSRSESGVTVIRPPFFGRGVTVETFQVRGTTALEVATDLQTAGPYLAWLGGTASAVTRPLVQQRFAFKSGPDGGCRIVHDQGPAISVTFIVTLPRWSPPRTVGRAVVAWWNRAMMEIARHERVHVRLIRASIAEANRVIDRSTCTTVVPRLKAVWLEMRRRNCRFDMAEYGRASGLSLNACVRP